MNRARYVVRGPIDEAIGLALHITIGSIRQAAKKYNADHLVVVAEGRSWRKDYDAKYKLNRAVKRDTATPKEKEESDIFYSAFNDLQTFINEKTNCTVLQHKCCEADDLIAGWIQTHPNDQHVLISGDSDFQQLLAPNVIIFDGVNGKTLTLEGVYNEKGKPIVDKKTKLPLKIDPEWVLFLKIIRGDTSDNVFSAYPGVRENKIREAFENRHVQGYAWCNFMKSHWNDHEQKDNMVEDRYKHNKVLIDLTAQPEQIKMFIAETIKYAYDNSKNIPGNTIGFSFLKLCGKFSLDKFSANSNEIIDIFKKKLIKG